MAIAELRVPDIGDFKDVPVIEVLVKPGDRIARDASVVVLESEKASMEVPATAAGVVKEVRVKAGDRISEGSVVLTFESEEAAAAPAPAAPAAAATPVAAPTPAPAPTSVPAPAETAAVAAPIAAPPSDAPLHASPAIRRFSRELGVDLHGVRGSGPNGRITREDVQGHVKAALAGGAGAGGSFAGLPPWPTPNFASFGEIERVDLPRIKRLSGPNLHRNWVQIPHITNYDEADVTELEAFRERVNAERSKHGGAKLTMLTFLIKACVAALQHFPEFNSSLVGEGLVLKRYYNIGFAADTPGGLVVPVLKGAEKLGLIEIATRSAELAARARDGKLPLADMQGGSFTISSIGSIGGTQFTQIVNAPEVAILGATRAAMKPVWDGTAFVPRLIQPISVSYDHRVIDGAGAARFLRFVAELLGDFKRIAL